MTENNVTSVSYILYCSHELTNCITIQECLKHRAEVKINER